MATSEPLQAPASLRWKIARGVASHGTAGAALCSIHCAFMPVALVLLPVLGLGFLSSPTFEIGFVLFATTLAITSLWHGYTHHRAYHAFLWLVPGLVLLWSGIFVPPLHENAVAHAITMSLGGSLVALAHLANMRLSRGHTH
jgi:hypothetical protein